VGGPKSAKRGPNPPADTDRGGPNPLADMDRGVQIDYVCKSREEFTAVLYCDATKGFE